MDVLIIFEENYYLGQFLKHYLFGDYQILIAKSYDEVLNYLDVLDFDRNKVGLYVTPDRNYSDVKSILGSQAKTPYQLFKLDFLNQYRCNGYIDIKQLKSHLDILR